MAFTGKNGEYDMYKIHIPNIVEYVLKVKSSKSLKLFVYRNKSL